MEFIFRLANDELCRKMSFKSEPVSWPTHEAWFNARLAEGIPWFLASHGGNPCGYARFQAPAGQTWQKNSCEAVVSIALAPQFRGLGLAKELLARAAAQVLAATNVRRIRAFVKNENRASLAVFTKCHFIPAAANGAGQVFIYPGYDENNPVT